MRVRPLTADPATHETPLLVLPVFQGRDGLGPLAARLDEDLDGVLARALESGDLRGKEGESALFYARGGGGGPARVLCVGVGKPGKYDGRAVRKYAGRAVRAAEARGLTRLVLHLESDGSLEGEALVQAGAEGATLAAWRFVEEKTEAGRREDDEPPVDVEEVAIHAEGEG
ncbi:MAG TPA: M17 family peptidase N-terminal domain-containing protein, partial [Longimicrobiales bacterium]|nr:M17 family peptidase N-terminal domain-containing protein [Longimicrobiales bacterium]